MNKCVIAGAWEFSEITVNLNDCFVIAADGGYKLLVEKGIACDLVIGDFDSLREIPAGVEIIRLPEIKDDTDIFAAIKYGLNKRFTEFHIYGGIGGRLDHTIANIQCLAYLTGHGAKGFLYGENEVITCVKNGGIELDAAPGAVFSVFAMNGAARGVRLRGVKYPLENAELNGNYPVGVSNEFIGGTAEIIVENGMLIIISPKNF